MDFLQRSSKFSVSLSKIASVLITSVVLITAAAISRLTLPYFIAAVSATFPRLWYSARFLLSPPYLFITIHLIIVAIWKLSEQKVSRNPNGKSPDAVKAVDSIVTPLNTPSDEITEISDAVTPIYAEKSAESCLTTDSYENSAVSSRFETVDSKESEDEGLDLEDTWQTIVMKKSAAWERSSETVAADLAGKKVVRRSVTFKDSPATVPVAEVNDEMNRKFEEFIKKNYDQIRSY